MTRKAKAPIAAGASKVVNAKSTYGDHTEKTAKNQALPAPGTALTAFLKKYRDELLCYPQTPEVVRILELVAPLLALAGGRQ